MGSRHLAALLVVGGLLFSACSTSPFANGAPTGTYGTQACRDVHDAPWCELIFEAVATSPELKVDHEGIADVRIIPNPPGAIYGGGAPLFVRVTFTDGTKQDIYLGCGGTDTSPVCTGVPATPMPLFGGTDIAWQSHDLPCPSEPPDGCATPVPTADPKVAARSSPVRVDRLDIPVDRTGDYRVGLGRGTLANGRLSEVSYGFVDKRPAGVRIMKQSPYIDIESLEPDGKPFGNVYDHGWRKGLERIAVYLVFHIDDFEPGAVISVKDVVVR